MLPLQYLRNSIAVASCTGSLTTKFPNCFSRVGSFTKFVLADCGREKTRGVSSTHRYCSNKTNEPHDENQSSGEKPNSTFEGDGRQPEDDVFRRTFRVLSDDVKEAARGNFRRSKDMLPTEVDIAIVGGGIMGSSIAYWLKQRAPESFSLITVERDPKYTHASTTLSLGGIRQQFSLEENIQMSLFSADFLRNIKKNLSVLDHDPPDIQFQPHGYLFLASEEGAHLMKANHEIQTKAGAKVDLLTPEKLKERFPWINVDGVALASHGIQSEGWFDPWALLLAFKRKAISLGAQYINGEVVGFDFHKRWHTNVIQENEDIPEAVNHMLIKLENGQLHKVKFAILIVAAGAFSGHVGKLLRMGTESRGLRSVPIPVEPRKRYVYVVHNPDGPGIDFPLVINPSGVYCRREGLQGNYLCGRSPTPYAAANDVQKMKEQSEEPDVSNLDVDYTFFENAVWPELAHRIPVFESLKLKSAWAGYYDYNTYDQNAIIGPHPYHGNVFFATGFSGHGIQMAPAVGRAIMELILDGNYQTIDFSRFGVERIFLNEPIYEQHIV